MAKSNKAIAITVAVISAFLVAGCDDDDIFAGTHSTGSRTPEPVEQGEGDGGGAGGGAGY